MADEKDRIVPFNKKIKDANDMLATEEEKKNLLESIENAVDITPNVSLFPGRKEEEESNPQLKIMNEKYAFIASYGGKPMIMGHVYNEVFKRDVIEFIAPEALIVRYCNQSAQGPKGEPIPLGKWWLGQTHRREYETVTFEPDKPPGEYSVTRTTGQVKWYYNTWEGFSVEPIKGSWRLTIRHIWKILCNKDREKFKYVMRWLAWTIQNPGDRAQVALIFKGKKGAGKGYIFTHLVKLFGRHGISISSREHLTGKFNDHLQRMSFLFADEAYHPGDKEVEGTLKHIITEPYLTVEPKFLGVRVGLNCLHIVMASNEDWVVPATTDERRFFINEVDNMYCKNGPNHHKSRRYFKELWGEMENKGLSHMLYHLQYLDIKGWHPRDDIPETKELLHQTYISLKKKEKLILEFLEDGVFPGKRDTDGRYIIIASELVQYLNNNYHSYGKFGSKPIREMMNKLSVPQERHSQNREYIFPKLSILKSNWNRTICKVDWKDDFDWEIKTESY